MLDLLPPAPAVCPAALDRLNRLHAAWGAAGRTLLDELATEFTPWVHYPGDTDGHVHFFYHRHDEEPDEEAASGEHGHFHVFMSPAGMPRGLSPLVLPEVAVAGLDAAGMDGARHRGIAAGHAAPQSDLCHLLGVAVDRGGAPCRLFTTNRWVTGETWYAAADVIAMLDHARLPGMTPVEQWLGALLQAFRPDIDQLLRERDAAIAAWRRRRRGPSHEDRRLVTPSSRPICLSTALAQAARPSDRRPVAGTTHSRLSWS